MLKRDTSGLKKHAQSKRKSAFDRAEEAINKFEKQGLPVDFVAVAQAAGVSRTWLYKQPEIKAKIEELRDNPQRLSCHPVTTRLGKLAEESTVETYNKQLDRLKAENLGLRSLLRDMYGLSGSELAEKIESQQGEIEHLRAKNKELKAQLAGMDSLVAEIEELKKEKQHLFNRVTQLEAGEREKAKKRFASAKKEANSQSDIPVVKF